MEVLVERCAGLDVGKADLKACVRVPGPRGGRRQQIKTFATTTKALLRLRDWLAEQGVTVASWLPLRPGLTPHGLRHGHETWLDDLGVRYVLQSERMGHEVPGMRGVYSHITSGMREDLTAGLQEFWEESLHERARISATSPVPALDSLLSRLREPATKIGSHSAPKIGHLSARRPGRRRGPGR